MLFERPLISDITDGRDDDDIFREQMSTMLKAQQGTIAPRFVVITGIFLILIPWNLFCGFLGHGSFRFWAYGIVIGAVVVIFVSMKASGQSVFRKKFIRSELKTQKEFRTSAFLAFLSMLGIWSAFAASFVYSFTVR